MKKLNVIDLGLLPYEEAYARQLQAVKEQHQEAASDQLFFVEHPEVYTFGRKSKELPLNLSNAVAIERGGEATYHNPGQFVAYPILTLEEGERDVLLHLRRLENTLIGLLEEFGISAEQRPGATGVWVVGKEKKIASIGIAVSHWITFHGVALNVSNDLSGFSKIHPCGFSAEVMTSMATELGKANCPPLLEIKKVFLQHFCKNFSRKIESEFLGASIVERTALLSR